MWKYDGGYSQMLCRIWAKTNRNILMKTTTSDLLMKVSDTDLENCCQLWTHSG